MTWLKSKYAAFVQWICWHAWDYARARELARREWRGVAPADSPEEMKDEQRRIIGNEARQVLENKHFREAFGAMDLYLEAQALSCDPDSREKAQRIVLAKQLLRGIRREIVRKVEDGIMAETMLVELEKRKRLTRFIR